MKKTTVASALLCCILFSLFVVGCGPTSHFTFHGIPINVAEANETDFIKRLTKKGLKSSQKEKGMMVSVNTRCLEKYLGKETPSLCNLLRGL